MIRLHCMSLSNLWKNRRAGGIEEWRKENRDAQWIVLVLHKQRNPRNLLHNNMSELNNTDLCIRSRRIKACRRSMRKRRGRPESCICACNLGFQGWRRSTWGHQSSCFKHPSEWGLFTLENQRVFYKVWRLHGGPEDLWRHSVLFRSSPGGDGAPPVSQHQCA